MDFFEPNGFVDDDADLNDDNFNTWLASQPLNPQMNDPVNMMPQMPQMPNQMPQVKQDMYINQMPPPRMQRRPPQQQQMQMSPQMHQQQMYMQQQQQQQQMMNQMMPQMPMQMQPVNQMRNVQRRVMRPTQPQMRASDDVYQMQMQQPPMMMPQMQRPVDVKMPAKRQRKQPQQQQIQQQQMPQQPPQVPMRQMPMPMQQMPMQMPNQYTQQQHMLQQPTTTTTPITTTNVPPPTTRKRQKKQDKCTLPVPPTPHPPIPIDVMATQYAYQLSSQDIRLALGALSLYTQSLKFNHASTKLREIILRIEKFQDSDRRKMIAKFEGSRTFETFETTDLPLCRLLPAVFWRVLSEVHTHLKRPPVNEFTVFNNKRVSVMQLFQSVQQTGGFLNTALRGRWGFVAQLLGFQNNVSDEVILEIVSFYADNLLSFEVYICRNEHIKRALTSKLLPLSQTNTPFLQNLQLYPQQQQQQSAPTPQSAPPAPQSAPAAPTPQPAAPAPAPAPARAPSGMPGPIVSNDVDAQKSILMHTAQQQQQAQQMMNTSRQYPQEKPQPPPPQQQPPPPQPPQRPHDIHMDAANGPVNIPPYVTPTQQPPTQAQQQPTTGSKHPLINSEEPEAKRRQSTRHEQRSAFWTMVQDGEYMLQRKHKSTHGGRNVRNLCNLGNEIENWRPEVAFPLDLGTVDLHAVTLSLASRDPAEVRQALDKLAVVSANPCVHESLQHCPRLLANLCNLILQMLHQILRGRDEEQKLDIKSKNGINVRPPNAHSAYVLQPVTSKPIHFDVSMTTTIARHSNALAPMFEVKNKTLKDDFKDIHIELDHDGNETSRTVHDRKPTVIKEQLKNRLAQQEEADTVKPWPHMDLEFTPGDGAFHFPCYKTRYERVESEICSMKSVNDEKYDALFVGLCDRLLLATCVLRNLSFSMANRVIIARKPEFQKLLWQLLDIIGEKPNLLDSELRMLDLCKDLLTVLGNIALYVRMPNARDTLKLILFLISFSPVESPFNEDGELKLMDYDIDVHRYLPNAVDVFVKIAPREEPNRTLIEEVLLGTCKDEGYKTLFNRWLLSQNRTSAYPAELLTRMFALSVVMMPLTHFRPPSRDIETRQPYLLQGSLALEQLVNMIPETDIGGVNIASSWLNSLENFGARLVRTLNFMGMVVVNNMDGEAHRPFAKIIQRGVSVVQQLYKRAKSDPNFANTGIVPSIETLLGGLMASRMDKTVVKHMSALYDDANVERVSDAT